MSSRSDGMPPALRQELEESANSDVRITDELEKRLLANLSTGEEIAMRQRLERLEKLANDKSVVGKMKD